ncbi:hypothetical protein EII29_05125 [Leptotrichia sp. OH3620_COT-345]|uniref:hypothetical protein n=1 Tax=Leptotrichia sp. OH3620_COT-345 TaxID=2491048 RepID=UPI000F6548CC|nr:hypothetical protein [Leptotrichia sp. OH3620_COT-345]RRD39904.1 hypothetical protein EII29_05125 [Leptotrichia sp. OH3620_COT-345]
MTQLGYITVRRRRYIKKNFYIDSEAGIERYARLSREFIFKLLLEYFHTSATALSRKYGISRQTVFNPIYRFKMPEIDIEIYR